jgi:hypothetical protein
MFIAGGAGAEFPYPAIAASAVWKGAVIAGSTTGGATLGADGRTLTLAFAGVPDTAGPCGADYKGGVAESASAVAVAIEKIPHASSSSGPAACTMVAQQRSVSVTLASPLGGRVVVDAAGAPVTVCPEALRASC